MYTLYTTTRSIEYFLTFTRVWCWFIFFTLEANNPNEVFIMIIIMCYCCPTDTFKAVRCRVEFLLFVSQSANIYSTLKFNNWFQVYTILLFPTRKSP